MCEIIVPRAKGFSMGMVIKQYEVYLIALTSGSSSLLLRVQHHILYYLLLCRLFLSPALGKWRGVCWSPKLGLFCAVGLYGKVATSPDGVTWTERTVSTNNWWSVCWSPEQGVFCAVAQSGNKAATSPDGETWTEWVLPSDSWRFV